MKKSTKVLLVMAAVFLAVGIGFTVGGVAMGATIDSVEVLKNIKEHRSWFRFVDVLDNDWDWDGDHWEPDENKTETASVKSGNTRVYQTSPVEEMHIRLKSDELLLKEYEGDTIKIEVENDASEYVTVRSDEEELEITSTRKKSNRSVTVFYPKGSSFQEIDLEVDAGTVEITGTLQTEEFSVTVGAGELTGTGGIMAKECDVEVGAGEISLKGIDAETISGECGIGTLELGVKGTEKDYNYSLECGIGEISIGKESYSGLGAEKDIENPGAFRELDLECGMGEIVVNFEK